MAKGSCRKSTVLHCQTGSVVTHLQRRRGHVDKTDIEFVVSHFMMESGGKVPRKVCAMVDDYLRRHIKAGARIALAALSFPSEREERLRKQSS